jgi:hypothetical protein
MWEILQPSHPVRHNPLPSKHSFIGGVLIEHFAALALYQTTSIMGT